MEFSLETASFYLQDMKANRFGFKCMIVGYDNPAEVVLRLHTYSLHNVCNNFFL